MARDGSGTYSLPATMAVANQVASSTTVNTIMDDVAQALTDSVNAAGTKAFSGNQSLGGNKITSLGAGTALTDAAQLSQVQKATVQQATTVAGTADAITLAFSPAITSYTSGMLIRWRSGGANTVVAPTVNIDSLGAKTIKKNPGGAALVAGDLGAAGSQHIAMYDGTDFIVLNPGVSMDLSAYATTASQVGQQTIWLPAAAMTPTTTNGAATGSTELATNDVMVKYLAFDASTAEKAQVMVQMPKSWDEGTIIAQFVWTHPATDTNFGVVWGIKAVAFANDDAMDAAFGTEQEVADTGGTTSDCYITSETSAMTVAGTAGAEELVCFEIYRDPTDGSDTMAVDAWLIGVKLHYTTDAAKDD
jgi:hypothetical protein